MQKSRDTLTVGLLDKQGCCGTMRKRRRRIARGRSAKSLRRLPRKLLCWKIALLQLRRRVARKLRPRSEKKQLQVPSCLQNKAAQDVLLWTTAELRKVFIVVVFHICIHVYWSISQVCCVPPEERSTGLSERQGEGEGQKESSGVVQVPDENSMFSFSAMDSRQLNESGPAKFDTHGCCC